MRSCCVLNVDLESREKTDPESVHIINIDIQDNPEEATIGAFMICDLCTLVRAAQMSGCMYSVIAAVYYFFMYTVFRKKHPLVFS